MKTRNFHKITMLLLMLMASGVGYAQTEINGIWYEFDNEKKEATVTSAKNGSYSGSVVIPSVVNCEGTEYKVTSIGKAAFYKCSDLDSVFIANTVKRIGEEAFCKCI